MGEKAYESMPDEEFLNEVENEETTFEGEGNTETDSDTNTDTDTGDDNTGTDTDVDGEENSSEDSTDVDEDEHAEESEEGDADDAEDTQDDGDTDLDEDDAEDSGEETDDSEGDVDADTDDQDADTDTDDADDNEDFDFRAGYKEVSAIFEPFSANGREMKVDNIEDARRLMQMGAGAVKQNLTLKPQLKLVKMLQDNDLLDTDKLNHLIDLNKKDPKAIAKLVKDSGIDPLDINSADAEDYKPKNYETSDTQFALDQAIDSIKGNDSYDKSISVMGEQWDQKSRSIISENPEIVGVIDQHIQDGVFDIVQGHVDTERALGRLGGLSDVEAYRQAAYDLKESGALEGGSDKDNKKEEPKKAKNSNPLEKAVKKKREASRKKKRKAAAPSKGKSSSKPKPAEDFSDLSDDEFEKKYGTASQVL